jgi:hypothetical protein
MPTPEEILADTKTYPDTLAISFNGVEIPLGSLRAVAKSKQDAAESERKAAEAARTAAEAQRAEFNRLTDEAREVYENLNSTNASAAAAAAAAAPVVEDEFDKDPVWNPVRKRLGSLAEEQKKFAEATKKVEEANKRLENMLARSAEVFAYDRWERQYSGYQHKPDGKSLDDVVKYATDNRIVDRFGLPSVEKALDQMTAADRQKAVEDSAFKRGMEEGQRLGRISTMPRPMTVGPTNPAGSKPLEDFDQLTERALSDPELATLIAGTNLSVS